MLFSGRLFNEIFFDNFFSRSRPCSHLFAVLRLLVDFNDPNIDTLLVRCECACIPRSNAFAESQAGAHAKAYKVLRL